MFYTCTRSATTETDFTHLYHSHSPRGLGYARAGARHVHITNHVANVCALYRLTLK